MATKPAVRRVPPPRTLAIDSISELQAFRQTIIRRWKLPRVRVTLRVPGLRSARNEHFERVINRQLGRSGGWTALWTAVAFTGLAMVFPIEPAGVESLSALGAWVAEVALGWVVGWGIGKGSAVAMAHWRIVRACGRVQAEAQATQLKAPG
ncbi:hypothetical protein [Piscinibacter gummiphilus]|uniref:Holin of 3TMs, for gene-transfer release n=1 Tax=Piscinibacter gummiphilus TaxID=946333 RepID=A0ABZ0CRM0_9BURK|nr:hypothetical protein [Piscinibacter gummiphilus]WOB07640.1 hypothetical protein RXV79_22345 [Piscinibacter gummiphilus]